LNANQFAPAHLIAQNAGPGVAAGADFWSHAGGAAGKGVTEGLRFPSFRQKWRKDGRPDKEKQPCGLLEMN
jgi:hypothetical protein